MNLVYISSYTILRSPSLTDNKAISFVSHIVQEIINRRLKVFLQRRLLNPALWHLFDWFLLFSQRHCSAEKWRYVVVQLNILADHAEWGGFTMIKVIIRSIFVGVSCIMSPLRFKSNPNILIHLKFWLLLWLLLSIVFFFVFFWGGRRIIVFLFINLFRLIHFIFIQFQIFLLLGFGRLFSFSLFLGDVTVTVILRIALVINLSSLILSFLASFSKLLWFINFLWFDLGFINFLRLFILVVRIVMSRITIVSVYRS